MKRDWTPSDQADAADADLDRNWWRRDPYADPDYREDEPSPNDAHVEDRPFSGSAHSRQRTP